MVTIERGPSRPHHGRGHRSICARAHGRCTTAALRSRHPHPQEVSLCVAGIRPSRVAAPGGAGRDRRDGGGASAAARGAAAAAVAPHRMRGVGLPIGATARCARDAGQRGHRCRGRGRRSRQPARTPRRRAAWRQAPGRWRRRPSSEPTPLASRRRTWRSSSCSRRSWRWRHGPSCSRATFVCSGCPIPGSARAGPPAGGSSRCSTCGDPSRSSTTSGARASREARRTDSWRLRPVAPLIHAWWVVWLASLAAGWLGGGEPGVDVGEMRLRLAVDAVGMTGLACAVTLGAANALRITARQRRLAATKGLIAPTTRPGPPLVLAAIPVVLVVAAFGTTLGLLSSTGDAHGDVAARRARARPRWPCW